MQQTECGPQPEAWTLHTAAQASLALPEISGHTHHRPPQLHAAGMDPCPHLHLHDMHSLRQRLCYASIVRIPRYAHTVALCSLLGLGLYSF